MFKFGTLIKLKTDKRKNFQLHTVILEGADETYVKVNDLDNIVITLYNNSDIESVKK